MRKIKILSVGFVALALAAGACGGDDDTTGDGDGDGAGGTGDGDGDGDGDSGGTTGDGDGDGAGGTGDGDMGGTPGDGDGDLPSDMGDLSITLLDFGPHDGNEYGIRVTDSMDEEVFSELGDDFDDGGGTQEITGTEIIDADETFTIQVWMDLNGDGSCGAGDHVWIFDGEEPTEDGDLVFEYTHSAGDIEIECEGF
jgi:hypothetical protein